jgi:DNA-binding response OmpR family regulator
MAGASSRSCTAGRVDEITLAENRRSIVKKKIIIVDDEPNVRLGYRITLETEGFTVREATGAAQALEAFDGDPFDLAILDMRMPEMDGLELLGAMRERGLNTPVVIITAYGDVPHAVKALKLGAIDFLQKPLTPDQLRVLVAEVIARHDMAAAPELPPIPLKYRTDSSLHLLAAKRAINNRNFNTAREHLTEALKQNDYVIEVHNLLGVLSEMNEDYPTAKKCYGRAIAINSNYEPAQQNMRRIFELFNFGSSKEPFNLGE